MKRNLKFFVTLIVLLVLSGSLFAASQELTADGKKNLRSANMHLGGERYEKALPLYESVIEENPHHIIALEKTGSIYYNIKKDYLKARSLFIAAIQEINDVYAEYEELQKADEKAADKFYNKEIKKEKLDMVLEQLKQFKDSCFDQLINAGKLKLQEEDYNGAIQIFTDVINIIPDSTISYRLMALSYEKLEDTENSIRYFIKTVELDSTDIIARLKLANYYFNVKKYEEAGNMFLEAAGLEPENPDNFYNTGLAFMNAKKDSLAYNAFMESYKLSSPNMDVLVTLSNLALKMDNNVESTKYLQEAVDLDREDGEVNYPEYVSTLCYKLYGIKKFDELIKYGEIWHKLNPLSKEAVQMLYNASKENNNKELMSKYEKIYKQLE
ncbi:MAG: tetratricopeptide repeat protein [Candidatus Cloacimonetes bacterium]|nr:tetratricopeptide repeat protein [Candidatus Cloacimonadota bacterium]MBL7149281.1 tetratricopeptide repeat protein [Candidatus Cloacimonadota bacterium]